MNFSHCRMPARIARVSHRYFLALEKCHRERERERERVLLCASIPGETSGAFTEVVVTPTFASTTLQETANPLPSRLLFPICKQKNQIVVLRWLSEKNQIQISMARMGLLSYF
jgi:hypothetical protein